MQHVIGVALGDADIGRLQACTHAGNRAVVVGALDVHHAGEAAFPFGDVVGHIGHKVGVSAVALAHDTVFVVAVVGGLEPQGAVLLVGLACVLELLHGGIHLAAGVKARLQVIVVKAHVKGFEVQVLFAAQIGHGKLAHAVHVVHITAGGAAAVVGLNGFARQKIVGDVLDVVAVVERFALGVVRVGGPSGIAGLDALRPHVRALGQGANLHARVVVIKLSVDLLALCGQQVANGVAQSRLAAVAHMQRARGVGRDEFDQHFVGLGGLLAKALCRLQHFVHHGLFGGVFQTDVDEARPGDFDGINPAQKSRGGQQGTAQGFGQLPRVLLEGFGQLHRGGAGQVAMGGHFGRFKGRTRTRAGLEFFKLSGQGREQMLFGRKHRARFYGGGGPWRCCAAVMGGFKCPYYSWSQLLSPPGALAALISGLHKPVRCHWLLSHFLEYKHASHPLYRGFGFCFGFWRGFRSRPRQACCCNRCCPCRLCPCSREISPTKQNGHLQQGSRRQKRR